MGQRLVVQIEDHSGKPLANAYYHWYAYTGSAATMTNLVLGYLYDAPKEYTNKQKAAWALFKTGARFNPVEHGLLIEKNIHKDWEFLMDGKECNRNEGLLCVTEEGMSNNESWAEGTVQIDIKTREIYFDVISIETVEDWKEWKEPDESADKLPVINFCKEMEFTPEEWPVFCNKIKWMLNNRLYTCISPDKKTVYQLIA